MEWYKTYTTEILFSYNELSDREFRALMKITALCASMESKPTEKQIFTIVNQRTYRNLLLSLNKMDIDIDKALYGSLEDAKNMQLKRLSNNNRKRKQRLIEKQLKSTSNNFEKHLKSVSNNFESRLDTHNSCLEHENVTRDVTQQNRIDKISKLTSPTKDNKTTTTTFTYKKEKDHLQEIRDNKSNQEWLLLSKNFLEEFKAFNSDIFKDENSQIACENTLEMFAWIDIALKDKNRPPASKIDNYKNYSGSIVRAYKNGGTQKKDLITSYENLLDWVNRQIKHFSTSIPEQREPLTEEQKIIHKKHLAEAKKFIKT